MRSSRQNTKSQAPAGMSRRKMFALRRMAEERGLFGGTTHAVHGRMPASLISAAKKNTGIESDTELIKLGLASLAIEDNYAEWLVSHRGTIPREIHLEY